MSHEQFCASADHEYTARERANRDIALRFYEAGVNERDYDKAFACLGDQYIQHNPNAADGPEGFAGLFDVVFKQLPDFRIEVKRIIVEGDLVAVHVRSHGGPTPNGEAGVDIFRIENGRIVEHWDVIRPIPDSAGNPDSMF